MTISLPTAMLAKIEHARQVEDRTRSEFVRQAIRVYLAQQPARILQTGVREEAELDQDAERTAREAKDRT